MYSAGDSSGDGLSGLNQFAAMSGPIDWAAMAQQWIQMHDTGSFISMPDAPPPPDISSAISSTNIKSNNTNLPTKTTNISTTKKTFEEQGEADMDMEEDEENAKGKETPPPPAPSMRLGKNREQTITQPWYIRQQNAVTVPPVTKGLAGIGIDSNISQAVAAASQWGANIWPPQINLPPPSAASLLNVPLSTAMQTPATHIPSLLKMNVQNPNTTRMMTPNLDEQNQEASLVDAKKRKMLPAWIREGLEKMEREKQRQLEKEQNKKHNEPECSASTSSVIGSVGNANVPAYTVNMKYNQYAEHDRSGNEDEEENDFDGLVADSSKLSKKLNEDDGSGVSEPEYEAENENTIETRSHMGNRNYEDRLSELMIVVRTTLTELLLEVTNHEIANLAQEAINTHKAKGLAAYDDSTGDEISDSDDEPHADSDQNNDSEEEIKASIRTKRRAFAKITDEIEERIAANAAREEQKLKYYNMLEKEEQEQEQQSNIRASEFRRKEDNPSTILPSSSSTSMTNTVSKTYERDFGETSETKLQHSNGKRAKDRNSRKERTTRFSDNKDSKGAAAVAATYISKMHNSNLSGNPSSSTILPITATATNIPTSIGAAATSFVSSPSIITSSNESSHKSNSTVFDDNNSVSALNKHLLHAAEAAYEKATKSRRVSTSRSSASRSVRERSYNSSHYGHKDHKSSRYRESDYHRERRRDRYDEKDNRDRKSVRDRCDDSHARKCKSRDSSDEDDAVVVCDDDDKNESQSSSDTDTSSSSSSSTSHHSSYYSRTSTTSKQHRERRDERKDRDRRSDRSPSRSRQRSHYHNQRSSSKRYSSAEDDYDNDSCYRHSSSRRDSSRKRSRSRSRSTYSSSSYRNRH